MTALLPTLIAGALVLAMAAGCQHNPFRPAAASTPVNFTPQTGSAGALTPATMALSPATVSPLPSFANPDPRQLEGQLARSRQETQLAQDELSALREQLAATSTQLAQARSVARPTASLGSDGAGGPREPVGPSGPTIGAAAMQEGMAHLAIPGAMPRLDGGVVRVEIPADKLFEPGTAALLPAGASMLSQAASEMQRVFPGQFIGIEGHTDTEPLQNANWGSAHQLSVARASAVFDFFTGRTSLKQGQLFVVAHGPNHPVVSNATAAGRSRNRRIELVIYPDLAAAEQAAVSSVD